MIGFFRRHLSSWPVKLFFMVLVAAFGLWGIGDVVRSGLGRSGDEVATVGGQTISVQRMTVAYRNALAQVTRRLGGAEPSPQIKRGVAGQALNQLVTQAALEDFARRNGLAAPDSAIREAIAEVPAFKGPDGKYSPDAAREAMRANHLTERDLAELIRDDVLNRQILEAVHAGIGAPDALARAVFDFQNEKRSADVVELAFADAAPAAPTDAQLHRWHDLHPDLYGTPEYRRIKAVILSTETVGKDVDVPDADLHAAYDSQRATFVQPEKRTAQIVTFPTEAPARSLAAVWKAGADWARIQTDAAQAGGSAVELTDSAQAEFPGDALSKAVFATPPGAVAEPLHDELGWHVLRVTKSIPPSERTFEQVKAQLHDALAAERASALIYERANKLDNLLASGATLDEMPADLGLASALGTLDAKGNTTEGTPAPLPGPPSLRTALIAAAFAAKQGEPPQMVEVQTPENGQRAYYAMTVEDVTPPVAKPYEEVAAQVAQDWTADAKRHLQDVKAAKLLSDAKAGGSLADAAKAAGIAVRRTPPTDRLKAADGVPEALLAPLFTLKPHETTMVETPSSFVVAQLAEVTEPDPKTDPAGYAQISSGLARSVGNDAELAFENAVRDQSKPTVNQKLVEQVVGQ